MVQEWEGLEAGLCAASEAGRFWGGPESNRGGWSPVERLQHALSHLGTCPGLLLSRYRRVPAAAPELCLPVPQPPGQLPLPVPARPDPPPRRQDLHPAGAQWTKRDHRQPPGPLGGLAASPRPHPQWVLPRLGLPPTGPQSPERGPGLVPAWLHPAERCLHG